MAKTGDNQTPSYSGIVLEPDVIDYEEIDPPLQKLIRLINSQSWVKSYGCCAGPAHHDQDPGIEHQFFIGLFATDGVSEPSKLRFWLQEANRLNGPTGLFADLEYVQKHPLGQGSVDGWCAYRVGIHQRGGSDIPPAQQAFKRMIRSLETAWDIFSPLTGQTLVPPQGRQPKKRAPRQI
jgi:hypothetical protein